MEDHELDARLHRIEVKLDRLILFLEEQTTYEDEVDEIVRDINEDIMSDNGMEN